MLLSEVWLFPGFSSLQGSPLNGIAFSMKCAVSSNLVSLSDHYVRGFLSKKNLQLVGRDCIRGNGCVNS